MTTETLTAPARPSSRAEALKLASAPGQPHEIQTLDIAGVPQRVFVNAPRSLRELYEQTVSDKTFIVYEDERLTFAEAHRQAGRIAHLLVHRFGVAKGDRVAISMRNFPEWILAFDAATSIGAIAVAMNALWQPEEIDYGLRDSGAKVMFADPERLDRLARIRTMPEVQVIAVRAKETHAGALHLEDLLADLGDAPWPAADIQPEDPATIFYTSGSTGHPKGVVSTQRNILSALFSWEIDGRATALQTGIEPAEPAHQPGTLLGVPLFHVTGSHAVYLSSYRAQRPGRGDAPHGFPGGYPVHRVQADQLPGAAIRCLRSACEQHHQKPEREDPGRCGRWRAHSPQGPGRAWHWRRGQW